MACNGCGQEAALTKTQLENIISKMVKSGEIPNVKDYKSEDGKLIITDADGTVHTVPLAFVRDLAYDNGTDTFTWKQGEQSQSVKMPFAKAVKGDKEIVFTLPDGSTAVAPVKGDTLDSDSFDNTIVKGTNVADKYGVAIDPKGGLERTLKGVGVKTDGKGGIGKDTDGNVVLEPGKGIKLVDGKVVLDPEVVKEIINGNLDAIAGDGLIVKDGKLAVATTTFVDASGTVTLGYGVDKDA